MQKITLKDKTFELSIPYEKIMEAVDKIAREINRDYEGKEPLFLVILNGSFMFSSDLLQRMDINCQVSFIKLSSYVGTESSQKVKKLIGFNEEVNNRDVIILEDIIDSGITMEKVHQEMSFFQPASIRIATLLFKPAALIKSVKIDYTGMEIPNDFIVGYGLDYDGLGRNLKDIYKIVS